MRTWEVDAGARRRNIDDEAAPPHIFIQEIDGGARLRLCVDRVRWHSASLQICRATLALMCMRPLLVLLLLLLPLLPLPLLLVLLVLLLVWECKLYTVQSSSLHLDQAPVCNLQSPPLPQSWRALLLANIPNRRNRQSARTLTWAQPANLQSAGGGAGRRRHSITSSLRGVPLVSTNCGLWLVVSW